MLANSATDPSQFIVPNDALDKSPGEVRTPNSRTGAGATTEHETPTMSTWDVIYGLLALGTYHQVSRWSDFVGTTPRSYVRRFHGGYVAVTRPENFPGALRAPDSLPTSSVSPRAISKAPAPRVLSARFLRKSP